MIRFLSILMLACLLGCASTPVTVTSPDDEVWKVDNVPSKGEVVFSKTGEGVSIAVRRDSNFNPQ